MSGAAIQVGQRFTLVGGGLIELMQDTDFHWLRGRGDGVNGWLLPASWLELEILRLWIGGNVVTAGTDTDLVLSLWKNSIAGAADLTASIPADGSTGWNDDATEGGGLTFAQPAGDILWSKVELTGASTPTVRDVTPIIEARLLAVSGG